ncbi:MAG: hypothetical protein AAGF92_02330 [Myxococcota bacterium]
MTTKSIWLPFVLALTVASFGCGDDTSGDGGTGGSAGSGGSGGSGDAEACTVACSSPCANLLPIADGDVNQCIGVCETSGLLDGCDAQTAAFVNCLEENDCPEVETECGGQAQAFGLCFNQNAL